MLENQRIVTCLDESGRSAILFSGPAPAQADISGHRIAALWETQSAPADNRGVADAAAVLFSTDLPRGGTRFLFAEYPGTAGMSKAQIINNVNATLPPSMRERVKSSRPGMHLTDTVDYAILLRGEITLVVDTGEVALKPGDVVVDRGVAHAWENRGSEPALLACIVIDALPLDQK